MRFALKSAIPTGLNAIFYFMASDVQSAWTWNNQRSVGSLVLWDFVLFGGMVSHPTFCVATTQFQLASWHCLAREPYGQCFLGHAMPCGKLGGALGVANAVKRCHYLCVLHGRDESTHVLFSQTDTHR
jgi:hypothetical protein